MFAPSATAVGHITYFIQEVAFSVVFRFGISNSLPVWHWHINVYVKLYIYTYELS